MTGAYCSVKGCKKYAPQIRNEDISFHNFPKDDNLKQQWIDFCQRGKNWIPKQYSKICSRHFNTEDFEANYMWELLNISTKRRLHNNTVPSRRENSEEEDVEEIILEYTNCGEDRLQGNFKIVDIDKIKSEDLEDKVGIKPLEEIDTLRKEVANLKRKTEEQQETIHKMKSLNESLAKDLHNERHRNLYLKNKLNLLEKEVKEVSQQKFVGNGVSQNQILLIVTNDKKDKSSA
ncbi:THAP domain-containing protein 6 [Anoplophora glabripennis]|uniref:THAP domain-containing protein 6 n=1 Tax=Anoplophora glabripennis TaxID=217634 RepID=UPI000873FCF9|nr:THAP domain-containing protein 6 [Anoplophora glabripennis]